MPYKACHNKVNAIRSVITLTVFLRVSERKIMAAMCRQPSRVPVEEDMKSYEKLLNRNS